MNESDSIAEIGIDEQERIYVRPSRAMFPYIYREAVEVHWEPARRYLYSPKPRDWTYFQWFQHIIGAAALQSCDLQLTPSTLWTSIPDDLRREIEHWFSSPAPIPKETEQERQQLHRASREQNYRSAQEPRLKAEARKLFFQGRYSDVVRIESQIRYPEFLTPAERQLFVLARKHQ